MLHHRSLPAVGSKQTSVRPEQLCMYEELHSTTLAASVALNHHWVLVDLVSFTRWFKEYIIGIHQKIPRLFPIREVIQESFWWRYNLGISADLKVFEDRGDNLVACPISHHFLRTDGWEKLVWIYISLHFSHNGTTSSHVKILRVPMDKITPTRISTCRYWF